MSGEPYAAVCRADVVLGLALAAHGATPEDVTAAAAALRGATSPSLAAVQQVAYALATSALSSFSRSKTTSDERGVESSSSSAEAAEALIAAALSACASSATSGGAAVGLSVAAALTAAVHGALVAGEDLTTAAARLLAARESSDISASRAAVDDARARTQWLLATVLNGLQRWRGATAPALKAAAAAEVVPVAFPTGAAPLDALRASLAASCEHGGEEVEAAEAALMCALAPAPTVPPAQAPASPLEQLQGIVLLTPTLAALYPELVLLIEDIRGELQATGLRARGRRTPA